MSATSLHPDIERLALLGWHLYPPSRHSRAACFKGAAAAASYDLDQLERWSAQFPNCNWSIVCGPSGILSMDLDVPPRHAHDGVAAFAALVAKHAPDGLPPRPQARSGGGGVALYFRHDGQPLVGKSGHPAPGIDPHRDRQAQTVPPSIHPATRHPYRWLVAPWELSPPPIPPWLATLLKPPPEPPARALSVETTEVARQRLYRSAIAVTVAKDGQRNDTLNRRSYGVGRLIAAGLLDQTEAVEALYSAARSAGLKHHEVVQTIRSALKAGAGAHA